MSKLLKDYKTKYKTFVTFCEEMLSLDLFTNINGLNFNDFIENKQQQFYFFAEDMLGSAKNASTKVFNNFIEWQNSGNAQSFVDFLNDKLIESQKTKQNKIDKIENASLTAASVLTLPLIALISAACSTQSRDLITPLAINTGASASALITFFLSSVVKHNNFVDSSLKDAYVLYNNCRSKFKELISGQSQLYSEMINEIKQGFNGIIYKAKRDDIKSKIEKTEDQIKEYQEKSKHIVGYNMFEEIIKDLKNEKVELIKKFNIISTKITILRNCPNICELQLKKDYLDDMAENFESYAQKSRKNSQFYKE